jgi:hypothetical protein
MTDEANRVLLPLFTNIRLGKVIHNSHYILAIFAGKLGDFTHRKAIMALPWSPNTKSGS